MFNHLCDVYECLKDAVKIVKVGTVEYGLCDDHCRSTRELAVKYAHESVDFTAKWHQKILDQGFVKDK